MTKLQPCPFCSYDLVLADSFTTKSSQTFIHPDNDCFLAGTARVTLSLQAEDNIRAGAWNTRPDITHTLRRINADDFATELEKRIAENEIDIEDYVDDDSSADVSDITPVQNACDYWRRGEKREALHHLENALGSDWYGLGDIKPEDLA